MGYTQVNEAAMPPLMARHTPRKMSDTPPDDQRYTLLGTNWLVMEYINRVSRTNSTPSCLELNSDERILHSL